MLALEGTPGFEHLRWTKDAEPPVSFAGRKEMGQEYGLSSEQDTSPSGYAGWGWSEKGFLCGLRGKTTGL